MRAVAYLRVSSSSQVDGHSLDAQARLFNETCKNRDWQAVGVYREEGRSAHVESINKRPVFRQILEDAAKDTSRQQESMPVARRVKTIDFKREPLRLSPLLFSLSIPHIDKAFPTVKRGKQFLFNKDFA